jgi:hypothetical protein
VRFLFELHDLVVHALLCGEAFGAHAGSRELLRLITDVRRVFKSEVMLFGDEFASMKHLCYYFKLLSRGKVSE